MEAEITDIQRYHDPSVAQAAMSISDLKGQVAAIQEVMRGVMKEKEHYGIIPGTVKPTLLKPGAEKLCLTFDLRPRFAITTRDLGKGHREVEVVCDLVNRNGVFLGSGVGSCNTMESKYRYRWDNTNKPVPSQYWESRDQSLLGGSHMVAKKKDQQWLIFQRVEHDNPPDYYNVILKMAKKRAQIDAVLTRTAASDMFTQDVEDMADNAEHQVTTPIQAEVAVPTQSDPAPQPEPGAGPVLSSGRKITDKQRKRMYAIARGKGCTDKDFETALRNMGYDSSADVTMDSYDDVVMYFEGWTKEQSQG